ncbi:hypothetical protein AERO8C_20461 [Aeromonas veronii]|uniref:Uncharacterized protein n=1 Tax=Aeromonas veronii TaxID=654 RepID=A0A653L2Z8_AERVE|nr:hypothetical protein AERO8C_20461 [Aeromonas veronii]
MVSVSRMIWRFSWGVFMIQSMSNFGFTYSLVYPKPHVKTD